MEDIGVMSRDDGEEARGSNSRGVHRIEGADQSIEAGEQLLPGIPDEITIDLIAPKLPWTTFHILSSVSHPWQRAIQSHEIYDARVRSRSTQQLISFCGPPKHPSNDTSIGLFSIEDGSYLHLPPIPCLGQQPIGSYRRVFLDGKLYVLGGGAFKPCAEVYVLDLAGQRHWKQCASMAIARSRVGCGVKDGKIYVFGGLSYSEVVNVSEVYDPKKDAWSPISCSMHGGLMCQKVTTVGDEFFVHSGKRYPSYSPNQCASDAEVYHPQKDKWRIVENFNGNSWNMRSNAAVLTVKGKLYKLTQFGIQVFDNDASSWKPTQPFSFAEYEANHGVDIYPLAALTVDDEVLASVKLIDTGKGHGRTLFIRSQGVGVENREVSWQTLPCSLPLDSDPPSFLIQL